MMTLRVLMLGRRNDPRTKTYTLCEPAQLNCRSMLRKSQLIRKFIRKCRGPD